jgi:hypothetical protein
MAVHKMTATAAEIHAAMIADTNATCAYCGGPMQRAHTGRPKIYCSNKCRVYAGRARKRQEKTCSNT